MGEGIPSRAEMRKGLLWLARMLVSHSDKPFDGPVSVRVEQVEEKEAKLLKPRCASEGMEPPAWFRLGGSDSDKGECGASAEELLAVLLSPDEQKLLADLVTHAPCSASSVHERCKAVLTRSAFWEVWGQLQKRGLVEQGDDERYRVGPAWLTQWLGA